MRVPLLHLLPSMARRLKTKCRERTSVEQETGEAGKGKEGEDSRMSQSPFNSGFFNYWFIKWFLI